LLGVSVIAVTAAGLSDSANVVRHNLSCLFGALVVGDAFREKDAIQTVLESLATRQLGAIRRRTTTYFDDLRKVSIRIDDDRRRAQRLRGEQRLVKQRLADTGSRGPELARYSTGGQMEKGRRWMGREKIEN
jgi:hypothetical protein